MGRSFSLLESWCHHCSKEIIRKCFSTLGNPKLNFKWYIHFTGQVTNQLNKVIQTWWHYQGPYPQSSGKVECTSRILKLKLVKLTETSGLPWSKVFPLALMKIKSTTFGKQADALWNYYWATHALNGRTPSSSSSCDSLTLPNMERLYCSIQKLTSNTPKRTLETLHLMRILYPTHCNLVTVFWKIHQRKLHLNLYRKDPF